MHHIWYAWRSVDLMPTLPLRTYAEPPSDVLKSWQEASDRHVVAKDFRKATGGAKTTGETDLAAAT